MELKQINLTAKRKQNRCFYTKRLQHSKKRIDTFFFIIYRSLL